MKNPTAILTETKNAIRNPYAWPGGYPLSIVCNDGALLCPTCAKDNWRSICHDTLKKWKTGWDVAGVQIMWEGGNFCDQCHTCLDAYQEETAEA
jgi:hypothetical protein